MDKPLKVALFVCATFNVFIDRGDLAVMTKLLRLITIMLALGLFLLVAVVPSSAQDQLATNDWERVQATGSIVFGTSADYPPFEFYDSNFQLDGFDIALAKEL